MRYYQTPRIFGNLFSSRVWGVNSSDEIFLTFDDGPTPEVTDWVLYQLDEYDAKATFFCIGDKVERHGDIADESIKKGHLLANHTHTHEVGTKIEDNKYFESIAKCDKVLRAHGASGHSLFRPPYGKIRRTQIRRLTERYRVIMWSHMAYDFDPMLPRAISLKRLKKARPGSIVVFHDSDKAFENLRWLLPRVLQHWSSLGYKFALLPC